MWTSPSQLESSWHKNHDNLNTPLLKTLLRASSAWASRVIGLFHKSDCEHELHQHHSRIIDTSGPDLTYTKSLFSAKRGLLEWTLSSVSRSQSCNADVNLLTGETAVWHDTKTNMNLQQPAPLIPPVHPDVQMKPLPFYDVLDVLIKPSSLGLCYFLFVLV